MTTPRTDRRRRRRTDMDVDDLHLTTATTKVTLQMALARLDRAMEQAEEVLSDEKDEHVGGG